MASLPDPDTECILYKKSKTQSFHQKLHGNQKINIKHSIQYIHCYKKIYISSTIWAICQCTSLTDFHTEPYDLWWVASYIKSPKIYIPLSIKLICGYTSSSVCQINFGLLCLTLTQSEWCKKTTMKYFHEKPGGNQKPLYLRKCKNAYTINWFSPLCLIPSASLCCLY